jgi:hypothetical protein
MLRLALVGCSIASTTALGSIARSSAVVLRGGSTRARTLVASATATENPLLLQEGLPRFASIDAVHVKDAVATTLMQMERQFESLEASLPGGTTTPADLYAAVVEAMEKLEAPVDFSWGVVNHLMGVKNSDELRAAHGEMQSEVIKSTTKLSQSVAVFDALVALEKEAAALEPAQRRIVANSLAGMKLSGVGLKGEAKETFNKNRLRLGELSTTFSNNLLDATKAFSTRWRSFSIKGSDRSGDRITVFRLRAPQGYSCAVPIHFLSISTDSEWGGPTCLNALQIVPAGLLSLRKKRRAFSITRTSVLSTFCSD